MIDSLEDAARSLREIIRSVEGVRALLAGDRRLLVGDCHLLAADGRSWMRAAGTGSEWLAPWSAIRAPWSDGQTS